MVSSQFIEDKQSQFVLLNQQANKQNKQPQTVTGKKEAQILISKQSKKEIYLGKQRESLHTFEREPHGGVLVGTAKEGLPIGRKSLAKEMRLQNCEEKKTKTNAPCTYLQGKREKRDMEDGEQGSLGLTCGGEEWGCGSTAASTTGGLCRRLAHSQGSLDGGGGIGIGIGGEDSDGGGGGGDGERERAGRGEPTLKV
uniref:Uncharacterized protein n=1 Tax=Oryza sativa subsp. japonica TaxID=39947 RepID=Q109V3_ORYSJ|nr:hypothetical protein LOC_Os10g18234 [Oryza sativa Japonica Group]